MIEQCWLAEFSDMECFGRLRKVHLLPKQTLKRAGLDPWHPAVWVPACGGLTGLSGHHGEFDGYRLTVPRSALSWELEEFARDNNLDWYLDRRFPVEAAA